MIIGLTGTLASGKGVMAEYLKSKSFSYFSLSDEVRALARENNIELTRKNLQDFANSMREKNGSGFFAEVVAKKYLSQENQKAIVDGIRNPAEIEVLKRLNNFFLVCVDAPQEIRFKRIAERNRENDPKTWEDFLKLEARDKGEGELESGQQVGKCLAAANFKLINDSTPEEFGKRIEEVYNKLLGSRRPNWDEYFLDIVKAVAKRGTCDRGRTGTVIAKDKHILVTGYAGAPKGLAHCDEVGHQMKATVHEDGTASNHCVRTAHAEQNAICQAAKLGIALDGATLYCKMAPCYSCAKMIVNVGIKRVVCEKDYHATKDTKELFKCAGVQLDIINQEVEQYTNQ